MRDEQKQREAQERQRRIIRQQKINDLTRKAQQVQGKINNAEQLRSDFQRKERQCIALIEDWKRAEALAMSSRIVNEIRVSKVFEGEIAEKQRSELPKGLQQMDKNETSFKQVIEGVSDQMNKLDNYISSQSTKLSSIRSQLNSL